MKKYVLSIALITTAMTPTLHGGLWPFGGEQAKTIYEICQKCGGKLPIVSPQPSIMEHIAHSVSRVSQDWKIIAGTAATTACMGGAMHWAMNRGKQPMSSIKSVAVKSGILGGTLAATASILKTLYNESPEAFSKENILLGTSVAAFFATSACVVYPKWRVMQTKKQDKQKFVAYLRGLVSDFERRASEVDPGDQVNVKVLAHTETIINKLPEWLKEDVGLVRPRPAQKYSLIQEFVIAHDALYNGLADDGSFNLVEVNKAISTIETCLKNK